MGVITSTSVCTAIPVLRETARELSLLGIVEAPSRRFRELHPGLPIQFAQPIFPIKDDSSRGLPAASESLSCYPQQKARHNRAFFSLLLRLCSSSCRRGWIRGLTSSSYQGTDDSAPYRASSHGKRSLDDTANALHDALTGLLVWVQTWLAEADHVQYGTREARDQRG